MTRPADPAVSPAPHPAFALAGLIAIVGVTLPHPSSSRMLTWPWALLTAALWLVPVLALILRLGDRGDLRLPHRVLAAGLALLALVTVLSAGLSPFSAMSLVRTWPTLGGVAFYFLLHDWLVNNPAREARAARAVALAGAIVIPFSLVGWMRAAEPTLWTYRNAFPFGHSNYTAGFLVLLLPWLAHQAWVTSGGRRVAWVLAIAAALFTVVSTSSRGGVIALAAVGGIAALIVLVRAPWPRRRKLAFVVALVALGVAGILANPRLRDLVVHRGWGDAARESNRQRSAMLTAGRLLGAERPLLGWGPGTVPLIYPRVRGMLDGGVDNVLELHNTPVQLWATLGLAGLAAALAIAAGAAASARRAPLHPGMAAALASLGGYAIFCLTDHQLDLPALAALGAFGLAILTAAADPGSVRASGPRRALAAASLVLCAAPAVALVRDLRARQTYDRALDASEAGRLGDALAALDDARRLTPHDPYFQHQAVNLLLRVRDTTTDPARRSQLVRQAVARLEASLAPGVHQEFAHFNLGWLQLETGDATAAARHFTAAARLVPDKGGVYFGLGLALDAAGRHPDALRAFALEWVNDPRSMTSPAWEVPGLAALRPAVRAETLQVLATLKKDEPRAATAAAWLRWWHSEIVADDELGGGFVREAAEFVAARPAIEARRPIASEARWARLYRAWLEQKYPIPRIADDEPGRAALIRRRQRHGDDFLAFLRAGTEDEAALVRSYRRTRTGYGVLALHPDGPVVADAYIVQEISILSDFATELFPAKGWLPGRFLLALLPPDPR